MNYAILDSNGVCINHILWDGKTKWKPPEGCTAVPDPNQQHKIVSTTVEAISTAEPTAAEKLASSGLTTDELKELLGIK
jgi:hypothetical protein